MEGNDTQIKARNYEEALVRWIRCKKEYPSLAGPEPMLAQFDIKLPAEVWLANGIRSRLMREMNRTM